MRYYNYDYKICILLSFAAFMGQCFSLKILIKFTRYWKTYVNLNVNLEVNLCNYFK